MNSNNFVLERQSAKQHVESCDAISKMPFDQWKDISVGINHLISYAVPRLIDTPPSDKEAVPSIQCVLDFQTELNQFVIANLSEGKEVCHEN
jgi:hypothetical protein